MDTAVALVQNYLYLNGYFTVTEFPVVELLESGDVRTVTDVDVLAVRFPGAGAVDLRGRTARMTTIDPALDVDQERIDLIIGEVKEGRVDLNQAASDRHVLRAALRRFGRVADEDAEDLISQLMEDGEAFHPAGVRVRLMSFGSRPPKDEKAPYRWLLIGEIITFIRRVLAENWNVAQAIQSKDPILSQMILIEKAIRGER
ncbi:MAG: hypothetical protein EHM57_01645 [Actinobacteria bacterium]|nr:MAG: hypothetical protein EHM57_01645 [Actinomycetota bacterium]